MVSAPKSLCQSEEDTYKTNYTIKHSMTDDKVLKNMDERELDSTPGIGKNFLEKVSFNWILKDESKSGLGKVEVKSIPGTKYYVKRYRSRKV